MSNGNGGNKDSAGKPENGNNSDHVPPAGNSGYQPAPGEILVNPTEYGSGSNNGGNSDSGTGKRKRGRPKGSRNSATGTASSPHLDVNGIEAILLSSHAMLAAITRVPELELDADDGKKLSQGIASVARHYDFPNAAQKTIDWTNLAMVMAGIYGAKIYLIRQRARRQSEPESDSDPVLDFNTMRNAVRKDNLQ